MSNCGNVQLNVTGTVNINNCCDCSSSIPPINSYMIVKTADQTVFGTTLVDDAQLLFSASAGDTWGVHFDLWTSADDIESENGRMYCAIMAPTGSTATANCMVIVRDPDGNCTSQIQGPLPPATQGEPSSKFGWGAPGSTSNPAYAWVRIAAVVVVGSTPGPVGLQFSEVTTSSPTGAVVYGGSSLFASKQT